MKNHIKTEETKRKLSKSLTGRTISWKDKISKTLTGRKLPLGHPFNIKGKTPWNYIDGRSKLLGPARYGDDWDKIRYLIYLRDKFTCQHCGIKGERLDVHHKVPFLISRNNSLNNLITLCRPCHMKEEKRIINQLKLKNLEII